MRVTEIETFRAIMTSGSARKAAALLGVTQPAISQSLKRLETEAGFALFQRLRGRLHPTPEAKALLVEVERMFVGLGAIEHRVKSLREFGVDQLQVACYPAFGLGFMPRCLKQLMASAAKSPRPHVSLQVLSSKEVKDRVVSGLADFGLMADEVSVDGLEPTTFATFPGVVVMKKGHPLARHKQIQPEQLAELPFLALNPEDASRRRLDAKLAEHGVTLSVSIHTPYAVSVCEMALHGLGVGVINPITALDYADRGLVVRKLSVDVTFSCFLAIPAGQVLSGTAKKFLAIMRAQLQADNQKLREYLKAA
ncbi:LysR family transcriptional regulator [Caenimonas sedimenti]|uniref:LysR family transcriptional regulator n=1 Tax=Caenimonas sedimenti TaxID=2596921 RepID=A0A562ZCU9_9BURK|nr:LysR substrate-binding domain-containing protein [Caenimonas sedimenti]TWO63322.1 LysR family transcriptional regulator [Caenimonas sedimenti]